MTDYTALYASAVIKPAKAAELKAAAAKITAGKDRIQAVAAQLGNGIPWWFIGIIQYMEAGINKDIFKYHIHCGDPLTDRTVHVPAGRPMAGNPPFTWEESAIDGLKYMKYDKVTDWSLSNCLYLFEKFNGMGYAKRGLLSPYVWSFTSHYVSGKYATDGHYDPSLVSKQPGTAALMKTLGV